SLTIEQHEGGQHPDSVGARERTGFVVSHGVGNLPRLLGLGSQSGVVVDADTHELEIGAVLLVGAGQGGRRAPARAAPAREYLDQNGLVFAVGEAPAHRFSDGRADERQIDGWSFGSFRRSAATAA